MSARLTPLHRFAPHLHTLPTSDEASAIDVPIPLPAATITTPWPPRRGGAGFALPSLDHLPAGAAAMDAGDRTQATGSTIDEARRESWAAGMNEGTLAGAERRCWWDMFAGFMLGACLSAIVVVGGIKLGIWTAQPPATAAAQPAADSAAPATTSRWDNRA